MLTPNNLIEPAAEQIASLAVLEYLRDLFGASTRTTFSKEEILRVIQLTHETLEPEPFIAFEHVGAAKC